MKKRILFNGFLKQVFRSPGIYQTAYVYSGKMQENIFTDLLQLYGYEQTNMQEGASYNKTPSFAITWTLHFIKKGMCKIIGKEGEFLLTEGKIFLERHQTERTYKVPEGKEFEKISLHLLRTPALESIFGPFFHIENDLCSLKDPEDFPETLEEIHSLVSGPALTKNQYRRLSLLLYQALNCIDFSRKEHYQQEHLLVKLAHAIKQDPAAFKNVESIITFTNLSRRGVFQLFKENFQCTPMQYIIGQRLQRSQWFLCCYRNTPVSEIAKLCGYNSPNFFIRDFKRFFHCTPGKYRSDHFDQRLSGK